MKYPRQIGNIQGYFLGAQKWCILMSQEIEQSGQETCMDEHRTPVNTKVQMRDTQEKEAGTEHLKHKQRCCQSMQKCNKEG